jgi:hypothetical protein
MKQLFEVCLPGIIFLAVLGSLFMYIYFGDFIVAVLENIVRGMLN